MACGGCGGRRARRPVGGPRRATRPARTTRATSPPRVRSSRARKQRAAQQSTRLGPLVKIKNVSKQAVAFDDVAGLPRRVAPGKWVYVFRAQVDAALLNEGLERMDG